MRLRATFPQAGLPPAGIPRGSRDLPGGCTGPGTCRRRNRRARLAGRAQAPAVAWLEKVRFCERIRLTFVGDTCMVTVT